MRPHVDVIVRTIPGRLHLLRDAVQSVASLKEASPHAILVVHGGSHSDVADVKKLVARGFEWNITPTVVTASDGAGKKGRPLNVGLRHVDGEFLAFLDDDDILYPNFAADLISSMRRDPSLTVAYGSSQVVVSATPDSPAKAGDRFGWPFDRARLFVENYIRINSLVVRVSDLRREAVTFDEEAEMFEDWTFLCELATWARFGYVDEVVSEYRLRENGDHAIYRFTETQRAEEQRRIQDIWSTRLVTLPASELQAIVRRERETVRRECEAEDRVAALNGEVIALLRTLGQVVHSRSWRATRLARRLVGSELPEEVPGRGALPKRE